MKYDADVKKPLTAEDRMDAMRKSVEKAALALVADLIIENEDMREQIYHLRSDLDKYWGRWKVRDDAVAKQQRRVNSELRNAMKAINYHEHRLAEEGVHDGD